MDIVESKYNEFINRCKTFNEIVVTKPINSDKITAINYTLNNLNGLEYKTFPVTDHLLARTVCVNCCHIPTECDTLIVKALHLISALVSDQKIDIPIVEIELIIEWILSCIEKNSNVIICEALHTIQVLLKDKFDGLNEDLKQKLLSDSGLLMKLLRNPLCMKDVTVEYDSHNKSAIRISVITCLEVLFQNYEQAVEYQIDEMLKIFLSVMYQTTVDSMGTVEFCTLLTSTMNILKNITLHYDDSTDEYIGELLGAAKAYMMYGIPDTDCIRPQKINISQRAVPESLSPNARKGGKVAKVRKPRVGNKFHKRNATKEKEPIVDSNGQEYFIEFRTKPTIDLEELNVSSSHRTSDSDLSDTESNHAQFHRYKYAKLRLSALLLIGSVAKTIDKRTLFGYWHSFFPLELINPSNLNLLNCFLRDPNPRCRMAALQTIALILYESRRFVMQAETSDKQLSSFVPFSVTLGQMVVSMYKALTQSLSNESYLPVLTQVLKCLCVLIQATPFHRLQKGLVTAFMVYIKRLIYHKDPTVQSSAFRVIQFLISTNDMTVEIFECTGLPNCSNEENNLKMHESGLDEVIDSEFYEHETNSESDEEIIVDNNNKTQRVSMPWLLKITLENLGIVVSNYKNSITNVLPAIRVECLQLLNSIGIHFDFLKNHLEPVARALILVFDDVIPNIRAQAAKCLDTIGHSINLYLLSGKNSQIELNSCIRFWQDLLPTVTAIIQDQNQIINLRVLCCDAFSNIGVHVFERLSRSTQIFIITLLSGSAAVDEECSLRAASCRTMAVYALYPSMREDPCYIENTAESIIKLIEVDNVNVRIKGMWALANTTEAILANSADLSTDESILKSLLNSSVLACKDNDRIRSNAVRAIGNLLRLLNIDLLERAYWQDLTMKSIKVLITNCSTGGNVKVKWNACYALGSFMKNPIMYHDNLNLEWKSIVFPALCEVLVNSPNFKVRINAAIALTVPIERNFYGTYYLSVWKSLLMALEKAEHLNDFNEYNHRDNLIEQLCVSLSNILLITTVNDIDELSRHLQPYIHVTNSNWCRVINRVVSEKSTIILNVDKKLIDLNMECRSGSEHKSIDVLRSCFTAAITGD